MKPGLRVLPFFGLLGFVLTACSGSESTAPDTVAPQVSITAPTTAATYVTGQGTVTVSGISSDDRGVTAVTYSIAGGSSGSAAGTTSWTIAALPLTPGQNQLTVRAVDDAGNTGTATLTIEYDAQGPQIAIQAPTSEATYLTNQSPVTLAGTASDPNGVDRVEYSVSGGANGTATGTTSWSAAEVALSAGENLITVTAFDELGNSNSATLTVTLDQQPPSLSFEEPTASATYLTVEAALGVSGSASDNVGLDRVEWSIEGGASGPAEGTASWSLGSVDLPVGVTTVTVTAFDRAGNEANAELTLIRFQRMGSLVLDPSAILTNTGQPIRVTVQMDPTLAIGVGGVRLNRVDPNNAVVEEIGQLFDNGNLANGDDILGDRVYSALVVISEPTPQDVRLQVTADLGGATQGRSDVGILSITTPTSPGADALQAAVQAAAADQLDALLGQGVGLQSAVNQLVTYILAQNGVASAVATSVTSVEIEYESGLKGGLFLNQTEGGTEVTRGGGTSPVAPAIDRRAVRRAIRPTLDPVGTPRDTIERARGPSIPLRLQTTGRVDPPPTFGRASVAAAPTDVILNQKALIFAPYEAVWEPDNEGPGIVQLLTDSPLLFSIDYLTNQDATVESLLDLTDYGLVVLATHGSGGTAFATGEIATAERKLAYDALRQAGRIGVWTNVAIAEDESGAAIQEDIFGVYSSFIDALAGTFPQSLIVNNSCESTKASDLSDAFLAKGSETYFGYDKVVSSSFAVDMVLGLIEPMVADGFATTGDAFVAGQTDPKLYGAEFEMVGNDGLHFSSGFLNGGFETGTLAGWTDLGDGRVISRLGPLTPTGGDFMAILSTGLGFTTTSGLIAQSFSVPEDASNLSVNWNFLSEEFLEWIGTQFQDFFRISAVREDGTVEVLFEKTIDDIAADFSCPQFGGPGCLLIKVSPTVVFDQGDVFMTDWLNLQLDLTPYRGEVVTLVFEASDIGDSIYDSVILLDDMVIN